MALQGNSPRDLLAANQRVEWLVPDVAPSGSRVMVSGPRGIGKSLFACELAVSNATGTPFLDAFRPWTSTPTALFTTEPRDALADRLGSALASRGLEDAPLLRVFSETIRLDTIEGMRSAYSALESTRPKLVVFDPVDAYFDATQEGILAFRSTLTSLTESLRATVVIVGDFGAPPLLVLGDQLRSWVQVVLFLREDELRRQVLLTTADRLRANAPPLLRYVIAPVIGRPKHVQFVVWPADPLSAHEARVYDALRIESSSLRRLRTRARIRHSDLLKALSALKKKGLAISVEGVHSVGRYGHRAYTLWKALPVTGRKLDDPLTYEEARAGEYTTGRKKVITLMKNDARNARRRAKRKAS